MLSKPAEVGGLQSWAGYPGPSRPLLRLAARRTTLGAFKLTQATCWGDVRFGCLSNAGWALGKEAIFFQVPARS